MTKVRWTFLFVVAVGLSGFPAIAAVVQTATTFQLNGVDRAGNPVPDFERPAQGKLYKDQGTGILVGIGSGVVSNQSSRAQTFRDLGMFLYDPDEDETVATTSDRQLISRPRLNVSLARLTAVYRPPFFARRG